MKYCFRVNYNGFPFVLSGNVKFNASKKDSSIWKGKDLPNNLFYNVKTLAKGEERLLDINDSFDFSDNQCFLDYKGSLVSLIVDFKMVQGKFGRTYIVDDLETAQKLAIIYTMGIK